MKTKLNKKTTQNPLWESPTGFTEHLSMVSADTNQI